MSRPDRPISLIGLDHATADRHRALIRVLARVAVELGHPAEAELLVSRSDAAWLSFPARAWTREAAGVWRGVFAVPAAIVERAEFGFALHTAGHTVPLPHPGFADVTAATRPEVIGGGRLRTRAVALATLLAVTTASSPALALAGHPISPAPISPAPAGHAQAVQERIEQLAVFAAERARAQATRRRARERTASALFGGLSPQAHADAGRAGSGASAATKRLTARHSASSGQVGARDCLHPMAVIAAGTPAARMAHASARALHCGTLGRTVTSTPMPPSPSPTPPVITPPVTTPPATTPAPPAPPGSPVTSAPPAPSTSAPPALPTPPGGDALGTGTAPAPVTSPPAQSPAPPAQSPAPTAQSLAPTAPGQLPPVAPPRLASSGRERPSRLQLPLTLPSAKRSGGGSLHSHGNSGRLRPPSARTTGGTALTLAPSPPGFLGPKSWTGTVVNDPSLQSLLGNLSAVLHDINRPPRFLIPIYMEAARRYGVPWPVLAAINSVETDYGRNLNTSSAGAIGWMQFEPSTWKTWGVAVDGHSVANPYDPRDAIFSAARYLAAAGAGADISRAIYAYNHAGWYVDMVLARARAISAGVSPHTQTNRHGIITTFFDQWRGQRRVPYRGGYLTHFTRLVASANMISAADFPYLWGGGHEQPAHFGPFDCSGSVSYVLQQAGYRVPTVTSGIVARWHFPAGPGRVTIFYNATHTFMRIGSRYFGTSTSRPGGGAGWIGTDRLPASYLANFNEVHVPGLRGDAFAAARRHRAAERRAAHATRPAPLRLTPLPAQTRSKLQLTFPAA